MVLSLSPIDPRTPNHAGEPRIETITIPFEPDYRHVDTVRPYGDEPAVCGGLARYASTRGNRDTIERIGSEDAPW